MRADARDMVATEAALLKWLEQCAVSSSACPTNPEICERFGFSSLSSAVRIMRRLEEARLIMVLRAGNNRVVRIISSGMLTAQGGQLNATQMGRGRHRAEKIELPKAVVMIDRSPCPRCGVRGDIGCRHRAASVPEGVAA